MDVYQRLLEIKNSGLENKPTTTTPKVNLEVLGAPGEIESLGRFEALIKSPLVPPYQGNILSCVHATIAFLNSYNSWFNDGNPVNLSWLYTYGQVRHYPGGTSADESLDFLCSKGQSQDKTFPSRLAIEKGEQWAQKPPIPQEARDEAPNWQSDRHFKVRADRLSLYTALVQTPLGVGGQVGSNWETKGTIYYKDAQFGHMWGLLDVLDAKNIQTVIDYTGFNLTEKDYGNWICVNYWKDNNKWDIRILSKDYPIFWGRILVDKKDKIFVELKNKTMFKFVKTADNAAVYMIDPDNNKHYIGPGMESLREKFGSKVEQEIEVIIQEVLESYPEKSGFDIRKDSLWSVAEFLVRNRDKNVAGAIEELLKANE